MSADDETILADQADDTYTIRDLRNYGKAQVRAVKAAETRATELEAKLSTYVAKERVSTLSQALTNANLPVGLIDLAPSDIDPTDTAQVAGFVERAAKAVGAQVPAPTPEATPVQPQSLQQQYEGFAQTVRDVNRGVTATTADQAMAARMDSATDYDGLLKVLGLK